MDGEYWSVLWETGVWVTEVNHSGDLYLCDWPPPPPLKTIDSKDQVSILVGNTLHKLSHIVLREISTSWGMPVLVTGSWTAPGRWPLRLLQTWYRFDQRVYVNNAIYGEHFFLWEGRDGEPEFSPVSDLRLCDWPSMKTFRTKAHVSFPGWHISTCFHTSFLGVCPYDPARRGHLEACPCFVLDFAPCTFSVCWL